MKHRETKGLGVFTQFAAGRARQEIKKNQCESLDWLCQKIKMLHLSLSLTEENRLSLCGMFPQGGYVPKAEKKLEN